jgi:hypothetical protein
VIDPVFLLGEVPETLALKTVAGEGGVRVRVWVLEVGDDMVGAVEGIVDGAMIVVSGTWTVLDGLV